MTREIAEAVRDGVQRGAPVVNIEDGQVWVSGMNSRPWVLGRQVTSALQEAGHRAEPPTDDGAATHGGLIVPVPESEEISDETHREVFGHAEE